ncbi:translocator protein 2 isoform X1 [Alexandromys fortis]|uniref:translocator protein 2 isoform X1 n=1 Tax=Alexandromys fortis TaxID=100897 RepID=UPI002152B5F1|nr:translocator protein 2 isoform X1 [Microtus fortis]
MCVYECMLCMNTRRRHQAFSSCRYVKLQITWQGCWEPTVCPLEGQGVLLTAEPSLQPLLGPQMILAPTFAHARLRVLALAAKRPYARGSGSYRTLCLCSYASYLVWKDLGGGFRWPLALPLGLYTFQLTLSWTFLVLFLTANNPGLALLDLLLLYGLVASMVLIWQPINKLAALLLLPYLAWLTVTTAITYRLWRDSLCPAYQP